MVLPPIDPEIGERQTLKKIREWYRGMVEALADQRAAVQHAIRTGSPVGGRFDLMTESNVEDYYDTQRRELDRLTVLNLVASAEASLKDDYFHRVRKELKDTLSRAYQNWYKTRDPVKKRRPNFDEDGILEVLKDAEVTDNHIIGRYRECLSLRHWVGHGRNWETPIQVDQLDPDEVYDRANALLRAMPT